MKRIFKGTLVAVAIVFVTAGTAMALEQVNGTGITGGGSTIGFNAKTDLTGHLTYVSHAETFG